MVFLNINESTNNKIKNMDDENMDDENMNDENTDNKKNKKQLTELLSDYIRDGKQVFILIYTPLAKF